MILLGFKGQKLRNLTFVLGERACCGKQQGIEQAYLACPPLWQQTWHGRIPPVLGRVAVNRSSALARKHFQEVLPHISILRVKELDVRLQKDSLRERKLSMLIYSGCV